MLARPDAGPGCRWMKRWEESLGPSTPVQPERQRCWRRWMIALSTLWAVLMLLRPGRN